ncbi:MAG: tyrosine-protein phosphatase [Planctomycetota bacterium]
MTREPFSPLKFSRNAGLIVLLIVGGVFAVRDWIIPNIWPKNFGVVVEGALYRSGELTPTATRKVINERGIRTIVDFGAHELGSYEETRAQAIADAMGVRRVRLALFGDAQGDPNRYTEALKIMTDPGAQPVLVHCAAGAQRTGCAVALYRQIVEGVSLEDAYDEANTYRLDPSDNPHLRRMLDAWSDDVERAYREGGTITYDGPTRD